MESKQIIRRRRQADSGARRLRRKRLIAALFSVLAALLLGGAFLLRGSLSEKLDYEIGSSSEVRFGQDGQVLVIDDGKTTVLLLDDRGRVAKRFDGGSESGPFFYAAHAAQGPDGNVYVVDIAYGDRGNLTDYERVLRWDGVKWSTVYSIDYTGVPLEEAPMQYGRILEMESYGGKLWFVRDMIDSVELYLLDGDGTFHREAKVPADFIKIDAAYDPDTGSFVFVARNGAVYISDLAGNLTEVLSAEQELIPYDASVRGGVAWCTELTTQSVRRFSLSAPEEVSTYVELPSTPYKLDVAADGRSALVSDFAGFYRIMDRDGAGDVEGYFETAAVSYASRIILAWVLLGLGVLAALFPLIILVRRFSAMIIEKENAKRVFLIVVGSLAVAFVIAFSLLDHIMKSDTDASVRQVRLTAEILADRIDVEKLKTLSQPSDYDNEAFRSVKEPLDEVILRDYARGEYYYYVIYRAKDGMVNVIMDFEDTQPCGYPLYEDDPDLNDYGAILRGGDEVMISEISAFGAWTFLISPIKDEGGEIVGLLEVGQGLDAVQSRQNELKRELVVNAAISTVVMAMLLLELTFLFTYAERKRGPGEIDNTERVPLRTIMFLIYVSDSMQDAFIAILCLNLYQGGLPIPSGVAVALPMSAQLLLMAVFSFFAGRIVERWGSRRCLTGGMLIQLAGFLCCLILGNYAGILVGKMLIGAGMGTVYVACNTVASSGASEEKVSEAFADVSAGTLSGLTIGAGLASVLLMMGGWRLIYLVAAAIAGLGLILAVTSGDVRVGRKVDGLEERSISFREFFFNRRVLGFFLLVLVPFMMALSFREYFFPLFAQEQGITEIRIGQIYLLCGMLVLYVGPYLSSWILKHAGALWSVVLASVLMGVLMIIFVFKPTLVSVIVGVVILSVVISFAYTCQYTYFGLTKESQAYGEGSSMGVYSVFESLGQTFGPVAYGALLSLGYIDGIGYFCAGMMLLVIIFSLLMMKQGGDYRESPQ